MSDVLEFPQVDHPAVSVLMALYGRRDWARRSLEMLRDRTPPVYEVIVVDNASPDGAGEALAREVKGVTLLRNPANVGFGQAIVQAADVARGEVLCILNSDALVEEGWLPPMLERLEDPSVGVVVPLYVALDGTVQEAGSSVGSDGRTLFVGSGLRRDDPAVGFPRDVDYGSAACLLVRAGAFHDAGGFSRAYGLGYYEDADLSLELRARGLRTVFEPRSAAVHAQGASSDPAVAVALVEKNRPVFLERQAERVSDRPKLDQLDWYPHRAIHARDWIAPIRVLGLVGRLSKDGSNVERIARAFGSSVDARATLMAIEADPETAARSLRAGVEVVWPAGPAQLAERPGHATVVLVGGPTAALRFGPALFDTQPQAAIIHDMATEASDPSQSREIEMAMVARADVVLAPSPAHARFVRGIRREVPVVVVPSFGPFAVAALATALAHVGIAIPATAFA